MHTAPNNRKINAVNLGSTKGGIYNRLIAVESLRACGRVVGRLLVTSTLRSPITAVVRGYVWDDVWIKAAAATADGGGGAAASCAASMAGWWFDCSSACIANEVDDHRGGSWLMWCWHVAQKHVKVWWIFVSRDSTERPILNGPLRLCDGDLVDFRGIRKVL
jgi:hypothetical protein